MRFDGQELKLRNPQDAQAQGIALVDQELSLVPELSVEDNMFLGGIDVPLLYRRRRLSEHARACSTSSASATCSSGPPSKRSRSASGSSWRSRASSSATPACSSSMSRRRR